MSTHGAPHSSASDNGPEFMSKAIFKWILDEGIATALSNPGKPSAWHT